MKKTILSLLLLVGTSAASNAQQKSCCSIASSSQEFAMLSADPSFVGSHQDPLPFTFVSDKGQDFQFTTLDGNKGHGYLVKADKPTNNYLFVIHEWWGLNDYIKQEAEKFQTEIGNVNVIAIDLYDNKVAATKEDAATYMKDVNSIRAQTIIKGAIVFAGKKQKLRL
jgi:carboxymethylenebutenolidase